MFYLTGDTHGNLNRILRIAKEVSAKPGDICCILGDSGLNFLPQEKMRPWKEWLAKLPFTMFIVQGNHDNRPENLPGIRSGEFLGGQVWYEPEFPKIIYAKNGEVYDFEGKKIMVLGGAYSVDKKIRIERGGMTPGSQWRWYPDEQMNAEERDFALANIEKMNREGVKLDYIFSHTVPMESLPFSRDGVPQAFGEIDLTSEIFLQQVHDLLKNEGGGEMPAWYAGHFHLNAMHGDVLILFKNFCSLGDGEDALRYAGEV